MVALVPPVPAPTTIDPTRPGCRNVWVDWVSGATVRQGLPARIEKT